jgi:aminoglycoside phosphotransferase (APT) family kinase protein
MSRTGIEEKPEWRNVPLEVREEVAKTLGSPVARAMRVWGGFGPAPTYRLRLNDGRKAFFKGTYPGSNKFQRKAHASELRVYRELQDLITPYAPAMLGEFSVGNWRAMLLEDLGPKTAPPWRTSDARSAAEGLAEFHHTTVGIDLPQWIPESRYRGIISARLWTPDLAEEKIENLSTVAGKYRGAARDWLTENAPALNAASELLETSSGKTVLMHLDVRSDNLRVNSGKLRLFDWPHTTIGPPEFEVAAFAQSVESERGPDAESVMGWYTAKFAVDREILTSSVAAIAGYFANQSWQPTIPGLPRLRAFQLAQFVASLRWAAARLGLEDPGWLDHVNTAHE